MDIQLLLNHPGSERLHPAWNAFHTGAGITASQLVNVAGGELAYVDAPLPNAFWKEPHTGVIMLRPTFMAENRYGSTWWLNPSDWTNAGTTNLSPGAGSIFERLAFTEAAIVLDAKIAQMKRKNATDTFLALSVDGTLSSFISSTTKDYVWNVVTNETLAQNQGFCALVSPSGIYTDNANGYWALAFGGKFIIEVTMSGVAYLHGWNGAQWIVLQDFDLKDGGVNHTIPFQVNVIPFAKRFISVTFSQNMGVANGMAKGSVNTSSTFNSQPAGFLAVLHGAFEPYWDNTSKQWVKTEPAPLTVALLAQFYRYDFMLGKALYEAGVHTFTTANEYLQKVPTWADPTVKYTGLVGQKETSGSPAAMTFYIRDGRGDLWNSGGGHSPQNGIVVGEIDMVPSGNGTDPGIYTPELWSLSLKAPAHVDTSSRDDIDVSDQWQLLRFQITTNAEVSRVEYKLRDDDRWQRIYTRNGPFQITILNNSGDPWTINGYQRRKQPTIEGASRLITDQAESLDMWHRLNGCVLTIDAIEAEEIAATLKAAILDAGFTDSEVEIDYTGSPELTGMTFSKFTNPNDVLRPNEDTSVGDFVRHCVEQYGVQDRPPLRVRWRDGKWRIYLGPLFTGAIQGAFYDDASIITGFSSDNERWLAGVFIADSALEFTILDPEFNSLTARNTRDASGAQGSDVRYIAPDPRIIADPTYIGYEGAENNKEVGPSDFPDGNTSDSLEQQLRTYFDFHYNLKELTQGEISAEWQPEIDVDQFFAVVGRAKFDDPGARFLEGEAISYGAFRIDFIDVEIRQDGPAPNQTVSRRWEWTGSYRLVWAGKYDFEGTIPMWTADANLPL